MKGMKDDFMCTKSLYFMSVPLLVRRVAKKHVKWRNRQYRKHWNMPFSKPQEIWLIQRSAFLTPGVWKLLKEMFPGGWEGGGRGNVEAEKRKMPKKERRRKKRRKKRRMKLRKKEWNKFKKKGWRYKGKEGRKEGSKGRKKTWWTTNDASSRKIENAPDASFLDASSHLYKRAQPPWSWINF